MDSGTNQIFKTAVEAQFGVAVETPTWGLMGVVEDGEIGAKSDIKNHFGIGSNAAQARTMGKVDNTAKVTILSPEAAILNQALTRTNGVLSSYNAAVGVGSEAWLALGLKWNTLSIEQNEEDPLKASMDAMFKSLSDETVDSVGYAPVVAHVWQRTSATLTINDGSAPAEVDFSNCKIDVKNNLQAKGLDNSTIDHRRLPLALAEGALEIDATIQTYDAPTFNLEKDCPLGDDITLVLEFTDLCEESGSSSSSLTITCTGGVYVEKRQPLKPNDYVEYSIGINFTAITIV